MRPDMAVGTNIPPEIKNTILNCSTNIERHTILLGFG